MSEHRNEILAVIREENSNCCSESVKADRGDRRNWERDITSAHLLPRLGRECRLCSNPVILITLIYGYK
jgi:hypothetical protein